MLATRHDCYVILYEIQNSGTDVSSELNEVITKNSVPRVVVEELIKRENPVVMFYLNLNKKAHKLIKELLTCDGKPVSNYIKIASSLITQCVIAVEHVYTDDVSGQNDFFECLGLKQLSDGIKTYFDTGDYRSLVEAVNRNKEDVKSLLDRE